MLPPELLPLPPPEELPLPPPDELALPPPEELPLPPPEPPPTALEPASSGDPAPGWACVEDPPPNGPPSGFSLGELHASASVETATANIGARIVEVPRGGSSTPGVS